jgi:ubiquinone/menaquinone biosynthesis C-methylase UbiE
MASNIIHQRETNFHDNWAFSEDLEKLDLEVVFEGTTALENRFIMRRLEKLEGKHILDIGTGLGEAAVYFALQGALVTATDISHGMLRNVQNLADRYGVTLRRVQLLSEELPFSDESFDIVYMANIIHHVQHVASALEEVRRILKKGGTMVSIDPIAYNPLINIYRRVANKVRTTDEHPLTKSDIRLLRKIFPNCETRMFWFLTLIIFLKFYLIDRVHPNKERYWRRIYKVDEKIQWWFTPLSRLDNIILRLLPFLRWWCWNVVAYARK